MNNLNDSFLTVASIHCCMNEQEIYQLCDDVNHFGLSAFLPEINPNNVAQSLKSKSPNLSNKGEYLSNSIQESTATDLVDLVESDHTVKPHDIATYLAICTDTQIAEDAKHLI